MNVWKGKIFTEVPFGHVLIVGGKIKPNPNKISLDLIDSLTDADSCQNNGKTVYLKVEVDFRDNQIIRSMFQPGEGWQKEEILKNCRNEGPKNPLVPGELFIIRIAVLQKCFEIYVNEHIYGTFEYVKPIREIKYVIMQGDFEKITQFHHRMLFPVVFPKGLLSAEKISFQSDVPKKYEIGTVVVLECIAKGLPNAEFSICFLCNDNGRIILKFHVNFQKMTVTRTYQRENKSFSPNDEETDGEFPFQRGKLFKIAFGLTDKAFMIAVNGKYFTYYNYPHRTFSISTLKCYANDEGDFTVKSIEYHTDTPLLARIEKLSIV